jgi:hypothetical protein
VGFGYLSIRTMRYKCLKEIILVDFFFRNSSFYEEKALILRVKEKKPFGGWKNVPK